MHFLRGCETILPRHMHVRKNQIKMLFGNHLNRLDAIGGLVDHIAVVAQYIH